MEVPLRDGMVVTHRGSFGKLFVRLGNAADGKSCKCCASACSQTINVSLSFCGMSVNFSAPIPGQSSGGDALEDGSFLFVGVETFCGPCGWTVSVFASAFCIANNEFAGESFSATVPFSDALENDGTSCPQSGAVSLTCDGDAFGFPCTTTPTATIA
jgi:hypothetical protein